MKYHWNVTLVSGETTEFITDERQYLIDSQIGKREDEILRDNPDFEDITFKSVDNKGLYINDWIKFKTIVPKQGDVKSYINKPVLDKLSLDLTKSSKTIGVITDAKEIEEGYELTVSIHSKYRFEWAGNSLNSISMEIR
jgi:hypothetical protein